MATTQTAESSLPSTTLYYRQGASDKVYHVAIEPQADGFIVRFAFGRRGSTLQTGCKTASPVSLDAARKIYDKLVGEKTAKGYSPGPDGTPYQVTPKQDRCTAIIPQLLNRIEEEQAQKLLGARGGPGVPNPDSRPPAVHIAVSDCIQYGAYSY